MATREYNFTVGPETSEQPAIGTPSGDDDLITRAYADARYPNGSEAEANIAGIKAIAEAERQDGDLVVALDVNTLYVFDAGSSATGDDDLVLTPDAGTGRWLKLGTDAGSLIDLTDDVTGVLPIANGGTNGATATAGFDNLSPTTTKADIIVNDGTNNVRLPIGVDGQVLVADSTQSEGVAWGAGSSGTGEINYIENPDAEANTTGWATYDDGSSATPVDGTGGSPTATWTRQDSVVLRGNQSFKLTHSAADEQGNGVSYDFTIKGQDTNKKLKIQFDFKTDEDAGYATDDIAIYIYDVTNATVITPVDTGLVRGQNIFQTSFVSTSSTSYRLCIHIATTNATAWDAYFDNVIVGPGQTSQGAAIGAWASYTPTGSWSTNTTYAGRWRRVGQQMELDIFITLAGAPTAASLTSVSLPSGYTIDTAQYTSSTSLEQRIGDVHILDSGTARYAGYTTLGTTDTSIRPLYFEEDVTTYTNDGGISDTAPITFANGDKIHITASIPITEWAGKGIVPMLAEDNASEWQDYDATINDRTGSVTISYTDQAAHHQRVMDNVHVTGQITINVVTAGPGNDPVIVLPSGLNIDSTKIEDFALFGIGTWFDSSAVITYPIAFAADTSTGRTNEVFIRSIDGSTLPSVETGDQFRFSFSVPIVEYGGSQNSLVGYSEAGDRLLGLVRKNKYEKVTVGTNVTTDKTFISYSGLTVGRNYEISLVMTMSANSTDQTFRVNAVHDSTNILSLFIDNEGTGTSAYTLSGKTIFMATATSLAVSTSSASSNAFVYADTPGTYSSFAILTEVENLLSTSDLGGSDDS